jgi:phospholipid/cholesterol/gamma-HCH transport system substrate-binding protein
VLEQEREALRRLTQDGGFVLDAVGRQQGELSALIRAGDRVLRTTARRNADLEETIRILPTTLRELRPTLEELEGFSLEAQPVIRELRPAGRELGPALVDASALAPDVRALFRDLSDVIDVSERALPATTRTVKASLPLFQQLHPALRDLLPVVDYLGLFPHEANTFFAGLSSAFNYSEVGADGVSRRYFRSVIPFSPEGLVGHSTRLGTNRPNPYIKPRWLDDLATGLEALDCRHIGNTKIPGVNAPECKLQDPIEFRGRATLYPQIKRDP